jgi:hypothetical protein
MSRPARARTRVVTPLLTAAAVLVGGVTPVALAPSAHAADPPRLLVSELAPDNASYDDYEFVELANPGAEDVDLLAEGIGLSYTFVDADDRARDVPLSVPAGTVVPAGGTAVLWLSYRSSTVDSFARTEEDFRAHWAQAGEPAADYPLVRVEGQPGMANGGDRGIRVVDADGAAMTWSFYPAGSVGVDRTAHFGLGAGPAARLLRGPATATPGAVDAEALVPEPEPEPGPEPDPDPDPTPDPGLVAAPLQITELLPDSRNVGGSDGFEFIELYNGTTEPIDFGQYTLDYLYPGANLVSTTVVQWPSTPRSVVVPPAGTLVLWIKNGPNDALTDADFNAAFGTDLSLGVDLVEIATAGMANGAARGLEVVTNTGFAVNRAYYNLDGADDTTPDQGIQFGHDPQDPARQALLGTAPASPGRVTADQVPAGLVVPPVDAAAPEVVDATAAEAQPGEPFEVSLTVTDDVRALTVTLELATSADDAPSVHDLETVGEDRYRHVVEPVDLIGKRWLEYRVVATDGTRTTTTGTRRVPVAGVDQSPVRLSVADGAFVGGTVRLSAAGDAYPSEVGLAVDGEPVTPTRASLEAEPVFAFEATATDAFFRNGVLVGEEVLHVFDEGFYAAEVTVATPVPLRLVEQGEELVVSVVAGTKAWPRIDPDENNDDFQVRGLRLVLPDGRTLRPADLPDATQWLPMGDSAGKLDVVDARFTLPDDAFTAVAHDWDTTTRDDGPAAVSASDGTTTVERTVVVDNTGPVVTPEVEPGRLYQGPFTLDAVVRDAGSGTQDVVATLDGAPVTLPHATSSLELPAGDHTLVVTARDVVGNVTTETVVFATPEERPTGEALSPGDGDVVRGASVLLRARVTDPTEDVLSVELREGRRFDALDPEVTVSQGITHVAASPDRDDAVVLTEAELAAAVGADGVDAEVSSDAAFPYQLVEVAVGDDVGPDARVRVGWTGRANAGAKVLLHVRDATSGAWLEVDRALTTGDAPTEIGLTGTVPVAGHVHDGVVTLLVQHSEGFAGEDRSTRADDVVPYHPQDVPRSEYDATIAWESDTQYYNETYYDRQLDIHRYVLDRRDAMNIQYLLHTGDVVDDFDQEYQWLNADPAYRMLEDAGLPYGVLAGNHDVGGAREDYSAFSRWFGADRFSGNPWWGGDFQDNRGHYDLVTVAGIDLLMLYMGWAPGDEAIAWMNEVLARYPERVAVVNLHEYMLTTGGLGPIPQRIQDEVVATNPNVRIVTSGHYHDAFTRVDGFDDDGDGVDDRLVHQMLFDYQALPEGGQSFLRLLHLDNQGERLLVRTFSPYLMQYNSEDPALAVEHQEFDVAYADLGIAPTTKVLATDDLVVEVLTDRAVAAFEDVASGSVVEARWSGLAPGDHGWYVVTRDPYGAEHVGPVATFTRTPGRGGTDRPGSPRPPHPVVPGVPPHAAVPGPPAHAGPRAR